VYLKDGEGGNEVTEPPNPPYGPTVEDFQQYADAGYSVIPLQSPFTNGKGAGKAPAIKGWTTITPAAREEIEGWFRRFPGLNLGLVLGKSGLVAIDVDGDSGEEKLQELSQGDLPHTWEYQTPRGRRRIYLAPSGIGLKKKTFSPSPGEECALMCGNQQVVLPPSIHHSGQQYEWINGYASFDLPPAIAPLWMIEAMVEPEDKAHVSALVNLSSNCKRFASDLKTQMSDGLDNNTWFRWCCLLIAAGHPEAAMLFSSFSRKHNQDSEQRLQAIVEDGRHGMVRCTTLGCDEATIAACHRKLRRNDHGEITNSPGALLLRAAESLEGVSHAAPANPIYEPYIRMLNGTDYHLDERGNLVHDTDKKSSPISNFVARPIREVTRDDGVTTERTITIEGVKSEGIMLPAISVPSRDFANMTWVMGAWGIEAVIYSGFTKKDHLRTAIQLLSREVAKETVYTHMGWREVNGKWVYLHYGGSIGAPENVTVELDKALHRYTLPDSNGTSLIESANASLQLLDLAPRHVTIPLLALAYLSPLCEPLRLARIEPNFVLWLYGLTGTRKTSLAMAFLSHFGDFFRGTPPSSFKDTAGALEKKASLIKDSLLVIDDYHPGTSVAEQRTMDAVAQRMLRTYGDRVARGRLNSAIELRPEYVPRGMALVTGEDIPTGHSSVARFFGVEVGRDDVDLKTLTKYQSNPNLLSQSMRGYIDWLCPQMPQISDALQTRFLELRANFQDSAVHGRLGEAASWLTIGFEQALAYFKDIGLVDPDLAEGLASDCLETMQFLMFKQGEEVSSESPAQKFLTSFAEMLDAGKIGAPINPRQNERQYLMCSTEFLGWQDNVSFFLLPSQTYNAVQQYLSKKGSSIGISDRALWKQLSQSQAIVCEEGQERVQRTVKHTIPGQSNKRLRVLVLLKSSVPTSSL